MSELRVRVIRQRSGWYVLEGLPQRTGRALTAKGWRWLRAPRGAGPGTYATRDPSVAEAAAAALRCSIESAEW